MRKHIAGSGAKAGQWVTCSAEVSCRNSGKHISEPELYAMYGQIKQNNPKLTLKSLSLNNWEEFSNLPAETKEYWVNESPNIARKVRGIKDPTINPFNSALKEILPATSLPQNEQVLLSKMIEQHKIEAAKEKKSFFKSLFRKKPASAKSNVQGPSATPVSEATSAAATTLKLNVVTGTPGSFNVVAVSETNGKELYPFGNHITDISVAKRLHAADKTKKYQNGDCGVLAGELWNRNPHVEEYYYLAIKDDPTFGIHHFVKLNDGSIVDSLGVWDEKTFTDYWKTIDPTVKVRLFDADSDKEHVKNPNLKLSNPELYQVLDEIIKTRCE